MNGQESKIILNICGPALKFPLNDLATNIIICHIIVNIPPHNILANFHDNIRTCNMPTNE